VIAKSIVDWFSLLYYKPIIYFDLLPFAQHIHVFTDPDLRQNFWNEDDKARFNYVLFNNYQEYHKQGWYYHIESDIIFCSVFFVGLQMIHTWHIKVKETRDKLEHTNDRQLQVMSTNYHQRQTITKSGRNLQENDNRHGNLQPANLTALIVNKIQNMVLSHDFLLERYRWTQLLLNQWQDHWTRIFYNKDLWEIQLVPVLFWLLCLFHHL
jgi:hypothetical protein